MHSPHSSFSSFIIEEFVMHTRLPQLLAIYEYAHINIFACNICSHLAKVVVAIQFKMPRLLVKEEDSEDDWTLIGDYVVKNEDSKDDWELIGATFCHCCAMWFAGPSQWEDHKIGTKHRTNLRK